MAANTKNDILNRARVFLKLTPEADPSTSRNPTSLLLNWQYDMTRKFLLSEANWGFAKKDASLSATTAPTHTWSVAYNLPADYIKLITINGNDVDNLTFPQYEIKTDSGGTIAQIHTNEAAPIKITYTHDQEVVSAFSQSFVQLFALHLAADVASEDTQLKSILFSQAEKQLDQARFFNATQLRRPIPNHYEQSDWDAAHFGG